VARSLDRFRAAAAELGVPVEVRRFPQETRTAHDAAGALGCDIGQIVKSLVFMADGEAMVALTSGANRVDPDLLAGALGADEVRRANPEEARRETGFAIGGTPPFGHGRRLRTLIDPDLLAYPEVWAAAGAPDSVFPISPQQLMEAASAQLAEFTA
jgi:prolyl-tRNA editing enzyme YbaK/EbsC (Cys-tRNA(Pro) deacylase)